MGRYTHYYWYSFLLIRFWCCAYADSLLQSIFYFKPHRFKTFFTVVLTSSRKSFEIIIPYLHTQWCNAYKYVCTYQLSVTIQKAYNNLSISYSIVSFCVVGLQFWAFMTASKVFFNITANYSKMQSCVSPSNPPLPREFVFFGFWFFSTEINFFSY